MNTKYVAGTLLLAAAIGGYIYSTRFSSQQSSNTSNNQGENVQPATQHVPVAGTVVIEMNETGFSPDTVTIKNNTQVVFKNVGTESHWPASNLHPTHGIYPEFDPQRPIPPGESWSFVFSRIGTWKMHDHLMPRMLGAITVTE